MNATQTSRTAASTNAAGVESGDNKVCATRFAQQGFGVEWLLSTKFSVWVLGLGWTNLESALTCVLLQLGRVMRQHWGRQMHWSR